MALVDDIEPTRVFTGEYKDIDYAVSRYRRTPEESLRAHEEWGSRSEDELRRLGVIFDDDATLTLPPDELNAAMRPATSSLLRMGEMVVMVGPVDHAAPSIPQGKWRAVYFLSGMLPKCVPIIRPLPSSPPPTSLPSAARARLPAGRPFTPERAP